MHRELLRKRPTTCWLEGMKIASVTRLHIDPWWNSVYSGISSPNQFVICPLRVPPGKSENWLSHFLSWRLHFHTLLRVCFFELSVANFIEKFNKGLKKTYYLEMFRKLCFKKIDAKKTQINQTCQHCFQCRQCSQLLTSICSRMSQPFKLNCLFASLGTWIHVSRSHLLGCSGFFLQTYECHSYRRRTSMPCASYVSTCCLHLFILVCSSRFGVAIRSR